MTDTEMLDKLYGPFNGHTWLLLWAALFETDEELADGVLTLADNLSVPIDELNLASIRECDKRDSAKPRREAVAPSVH